LKSGSGSFKVTKNGAVQ